MYPSAINYIQKRAKKYLEKFFELSNIDEYIKKQSIRIFFNIANNIEGSFELIDKAAISYARESESTPFQTLIQGFGYNDQGMVITLLKFINQMIFNAGDEESKQGKFIAKLETLGIYDLLQRWGNQSNNEDIEGQITAFQLCANKVTFSTEYQLEVFKNKNKELDLHSKVLEKKVEAYKEQ